MSSAFLLKLLNRGGPVDRPGHLVVIRNVLTERGFESISARKMLGLQVFALQQAEPDCDLIQPGGVGR